MLLVLCACTQKGGDFTLTFGGDVMLARAGESIFMDDRGAIDPWMELKKNGLLPDNEVGSRYFFANLESPLGEATSPLDEMNLCADPAEVRVLAEANLQLVSLANNHREDCMAVGGQQTGLLLAEGQILSAQADMMPVYLQIPQGKLAVIAAEDITGSLDIEKLISQIKDAKESAQIVVVAMHWGSEYQAGPSERQQGMAQQLADAGADVIWGHHPHVLQKMEWLVASDGRDVLVMYSLGNLLSDQWMLDDAQRSALVQLTFSDQQIVNIEIIPLQMERSTKTLHIVSDPETKEQIAERLQLGGLFTNVTEVSIR